VKPERHRAVVTVFTRTDGSVAAAGRPFFFKQWRGKNKRKAGPTLDGQTWDQTRHKH
jgi:protein gp37